MMYSNDITLQYKGKRKKIMTDINWKDINIDKSKFILTQSEKCLNSSLANTDLLDKKSCTILVGLLLSITGLLIIMITKDISFYKSIMLSLLVIGFFISSCFCMQALSAKKIKSIGNKPKTMLDKEFSGCIDLIQSEALSNELKITTAIEVNNYKECSINASLISLQSTLTIVIIPLITSILIIQYIK